MMPEVSGMDLLETIRRGRPGPGERMLLITEAGFTPPAGAFLSTGSNLRAEKPFDLSNIRALIRDDARLQ
jgi:DNA-binding response OmpR family regulator